VEPDPGASTAATAARATSAASRKRGSKRAIYRAVGIAGCAVAIFALGSRARARSEAPLAAEAPAPTAHDERDRGHDAPQSPPTSSESGVAAHAGSSASPPPARADAPPRTRVTSRGHTVGPADRDAGRRLELGDNAAPILDVE